MPRGRMLLTFEAAKHSGPYDEYPVLVSGVDPQLHLSRNDRRQPFHVTCEKDTMLVQMSGQARVEFVDSSVRMFKMVPGDYIYVPGGTPHRIDPIEVSVQYRYKAEDAGLEAVSLYCDGCGELLFRETWHTSEEVPQRAYHRIVTRFNSEPNLRSCDSCGHTAEPVDLTDFRWQQIADELEAGEEAEAAW